MTSVSIIVPARDAAATLERCLASLLQLPAGFASILVVDDGARDGTGAIARGLGVEVLRLEESVGPAAARNAGVAATAGDILVFVDADVVAPPESVRRLVAPLLDVVEGVPASPAIVATFGSYDAHPVEPGTVSIFRNLLHHATHQQAQERSTSFWAGFGAITRPAFVASGGFDARRFPRPSIEDIELGARLWRAGAGVWLVKAAQATHLKRWTLRSMVRTDIRDRAWPWASLVLSGDAPAGDLNISTSQRLAALAAIALVMSAVVAVAAAIGCVAALAAFASFRGVPVAPPTIGFMGDANDEARASAALALTLVLALSLAIAAVALGVLLTVNRPLYRFFLRERGWRFAVAAFGLHLLYYVYSAATYAACAFRLRAKSAWRFVRPRAA